MLCNAQLLWQCQSSKVEKADYGRSIIALALQMCMPYNVAHTVVVKNSTTVCVFSISIHANFIVNEAVESGCL